MQNQGDEFRLLEAQHHHAAAQRSAIVGQLRKRSTRKRLQIGGKC
jgi:hypothetical protein